GTLTDADHHLLAVGAADCTEHVLHYFEQARPGDDRPRRAIELARAWARGEVRMMQARAAARPRQWRGQRPGRGRAGSSTRRRPGWRSGGMSPPMDWVQRVCDQTVRAAAPAGERDAAGRLECQWQRAQLPPRSGSSSLTTSACATTKYW